MRTLPVRLDRRWSILLLAVIGLAIAGVSAARLIQDHRAQAAVRAKLDARVPIRLSEAVDCQELARGRPLVLLALGQSNAANHGSRPETSATPMPAVTGSHCLLAQAPLPGATGDGGSLWPYMVQALRGVAPTQPVVVSVLGVDATTIGEWTQKDAPLAQRLNEQVKAITRQGFRPDLVLWQQGEADARAGTRQEDYQAGLQALANALESTGATAPIMLAQSTICRSPPSTPIRRAIQQVLADDNRFVEGPDTDALAGPALRRDGCHFNAVGLAEAGHAWARSVDHWLQTTRRRP